MIQVECSVVRRVQSMAERIGEAERRCGSTWKQTLLEIGRM